MLEYYTQILEEMRKKEKLEKEMGKMWERLKNLSDNNVLKDVSKIIEKNWDLIKNSGIPKNPFDLASVRKYFLKKKIDLDLIFTDRIKDSGYFKEYGLKEYMRWKGVVSGTKGKISELMKKDEDKKLREKINLIFNKAFGEGMKNVSSSDVKLIADKLHEDISGKLDLITEAVSKKIDEKIKKILTEKKEFRKGGRHPITKSIRDKVLKRDDYTCVKCGTDFNETKLHVKHIIPLSEGGNNDTKNLQTLCEDCYLAEKREEEEKKKEGDDQYVRIDSVR